MTPQINCLRKTSPVLRVSTHIYGVSQEIDGKNVHCESKPRHVTPQIDHLRKWSLVLRVSHFHIYGVSRKIDGKMFKSKPGHVTLLIDHLRKSSPVLRVLTHIYEIYKKIDGKTFIFRVNLGMWPLKLIVSENWALFWGFQHTFMQFPRR